MANINLPPKEQKLKLKALRLHLDEGALQSQRKEYVNQSLDSLLSEFKEGKGKRPI